MLIACNSNKSTLKIPARPDTTCFIGYSTVMGIELMSISPVLVSQPVVKLQKLKRKTFKFDENIHVHLYDVDEIPEGGIILQIPMSSSSKVASMRDINPLKSANSSRVGVKTGQVVFDISANTCYTRRESCRLIYAEGLQPAQSLKLQKNSVF